jgi:hypothetical protein
VRTLPLIATSGVLHERWTHARIRVPRPLARTAIEDRKPLHLLPLGWRRPCLECAARLAVPTGSPRRWS